MSEPADTIVTVAKNSTWQYDLSPMRFAMPVRLDADTTGYLTTRAAADELAADEDRYDQHRHALHANQKVHRLPYAGVYRGWSYQQRTGTAMLNLGWTKIVNVESLDGSQDRTMNDQTRGKLQAIVDATRRHTQPATDTERRLLSTLTIVDTIEAHGLACIVVTDDTGVQTIVGWPAWSLPQIPTDILTAQAITFVRSIVTASRQSVKI